MSITLAARRIEVTRDVTLTPGAGPARRRALAEATGEHLRALWERAAYGLPTEGLALACVGSLAREESGPLSDLDLVLLHDGRLPAERVGGLADALWYPLWESGLRLDHSVRTLADCRAVAEADLAALAGLLDLTPVAGDASLVAGVRVGVGRDWRAAARRRLPAIVEQVRQRHAAYGDLADLLEPDLKEAHGGLRDVALMRSLTSAWLADRPHHVDLDAAAECLLDVRDALHLVTGRGRERLTAQDRGPVAALLGYADPDDLLAAVSDAGRRIALAVDATVRRAERAVTARAPRPGPRRPVLRPLGHGVYENDGEAVLGAEALRRQARRPGGDPELALAACTLAARAGLPLSASTLDTLAGVGWGEGPWRPARREAFTALLAAGPGLAQVWEQVTLSGLVEAWIPQWASVRSRPQHDPVHRHTVDRHQLQTVLECGPLLDEVDRPDLLLVAALLHDMGKADGGPDHPRTGAPVAREIAAGLGFDAADAAVIERLVAEHLTLMELATTRDLDDPRTVEDALAAVGGEVSTLALLARLTRADAQAVGERAWTPWRARLVGDLVARAEAAASGQAVGEAEHEPAALPERLAQERTPAAADVRSALAGAPVVRVREGEDPHAVIVEVVAADRLGLFADMAGALAAQRIGVRRAVLRTVEGVAFDTWDGEAWPPATVDAARIARDLRRGAPSGSTGVRSVPGRAGGGAGVEAAGPQVLVLPGAATGASVVELRGADRPGLLRDVGRALARSGVGVVRAHIETYAGRCRDVFHLVDAHTGRPLDPPGVARAVGAVVDAAS